MSRGDREEEEEEVMVEIGEDELKKRYMVRESQIVFYSGDEKCCRVVVDKWKALLMERIFRPEGRLHCQLHRWQIEQRRLEEQ